MRLLLSVFFFIAPLFVIYAEDNAPVTSEWQLKAITLKSGRTLNGLVSNKDGLVYIDSSAGPLDYSSVVKIDDLPDAEKDGLRIEVEKWREVAVLRRVTDMRKPPVKVPKSLDDVVSPPKPPKRLDDAVSPPKLPQEINDAESIQQPKKSQQIQRPIENETPGETVPSSDRARINSNSQSTEPAMAIAGFAIGSIILFFIAPFFFYFLPTIVALFRRKHNFAAIAVLNFFLGWTLIGWVLALVWAVTQDERAR